MSRGSTDVRLGSATVGFVLLLALLLAVPLAPLGTGSLAHPARAAPPTPAQSGPTSSVFGARAHAAPASEVGWNASLPLWNQLAPSSSPPPRSDDGMAYDPQLNLTVLFGGSYTGGACFVFTTCALNDTWEFDGARWSNVTPTHPTPTTNPSPRWGAGLVYDPAVGGLLLFGGTTASPSGLNNPAVNDTWEFTASGWSEVCRNLCEAPPPRWDASFAYSPEAGAAILFGGETTVSGTTSNLGDTWSFAPATNWTLLTPAAAPSARTAASAAWDAQLGGVAVFGGTPSTSETWVYRNLSWHVLSPSSISGIPSARAGAALSSDPLNGSVVLFGGCAAVPCGATADSDTWVLAGGNWFNVTSRIGVTPSNRGQAALALGGLRGSLILFGGAAGAPFNDTWRLAHLQLSAVTATPSAVDVGNITNLSVTVSGGIGTPSFAWSGLPVGCPSANASLLSCVPTGPGGTNATVRVTVTDPAGLLVESSPTVIAINARPTVTMSASPSRGVASLQVSFLATGHGGTGTFSFDWGFGDGTIGSGAVVSHAYGTPGTYPVEVRVTDADGQNGSAWTNVTAIGRLSASAAFTPGEIVLGSSSTLKVTISGGEPPFTVRTLNATPGCGATPTGPAEAPSYNCTPRDVGTFRLTLEVNDSFGQVVNVTTNLTVSPVACAGCGGPQLADKSGLTTLEELGLAIAAVAIAALALALYFRRRGRQPVVPPAGPAGPMSPANLYVPPEDARR
ncbi:MAG TPA: PKD domain-containing protein [Thermoplasmata archaeon]|nr:PKD domain-containing protein [Thermoplasmata archaeon]